MTTDICSEIGGWGSCVYKYVILREQLNILLQLIKLPLAVLEFFLHSESAEVFLMGESLELFMDNLPLLLEGGNQFLLLLFVHEELLPIEISFLLDLHFSHKLVLVLDLSLNFLEELWHLTVVLLFQVILVCAHWQLGGGQDILNSVRNNEVFIRDKSHYWLFVLLWHCHFLWLISLKFFGCRTDRLII